MTTKTITADNLTEVEREILGGQHGYFLEVCGYLGNTFMVGRWYGTLAECAAVPLSAVEVRAPNYRAMPDPFDLACERSHDAA